MSIAVPSAVLDLSTLADLVDRLGGTPLDRIRLHPAPGTASRDDVTEVQAREGRLCELVEGTLVEKPVGYLESRMAGYLIGVLNLHVIPRNAGLVSGPDGMMELLNDVVRIPDVAFASWDRFPDRRPPTEAVPQIVPDLAVEILSKSNPAGEMAVKREEYFAAGVRLVWGIDPRTRTVAVYESPTEFRLLTADDTLDGGDVLPEFRLSLAQFFAEFDRRGT